MVFTKPDPRELEPTALDSFVAGNVKKILHRGENSSDLYVVDETTTAERIVFQVCMPTGSIEVMSIFKELLFLAKGKLLSDKPLLVTRFDDIPIDWIELRISRSRYQHKDGSVSECYDIFDNEDNFNTQVAKVFWNYINLSVVFRSITTNIHKKAYILIRVVQLALNNYKDKITHKLNRPPFIKPKVFHTSPLLCLESLLRGSIELEGKQPGNVLSLHVIGGLPNGLLMTLEYNYRLEELVAKDEYGVPQFYAYGIEDPSKVLIVNSHSKETIGFVHNNMHFYDQNSVCTMLAKSEYDNDLMHVPLLIENPSTATCAKFEDVTTYAAFFHLAPMMDPKEKALILSHLTRIVFNTYEYRFHSCEKPVTYYAPYPAGSNSKPSTLHALDKLRKLYIRRFGSVSKTGMTYIEVKDHDKYEKVALVFEGHQRIQRVEALCKDGKGNLQFSVFGIWGTKKDLVVRANDGSIIGFVKDFYAHCYDGTLLASIVSSIDPDSAKKRFQSDLPILLYKFMDMREEHEPKMLAQVNEGANEVEVVFEEDKLINVEHKALAICFGVRLLYELDLHKTPMTDMVKYTFEGEEPPSPVA